MSEWKVLDSDCDENSYDIDTGKERLRMVTDDYQMACDICRCHNDAPEREEGPRIHNLKMLDAIHQVVMQYSGNQDLADDVWNYLISGGPKGVTSPREITNI